MLKLSDGRGANYFFLIIGCVMMGTVGIFANKIENTHPLNVVFLRVFFSFFAVIFFIPLFGKWHDTKRFFRKHTALWLIAGLNMLSVMICYLSGTIMFSVGISIVLLYTAPIWMVVWHRILPRRGLFRKLPNPKFSREYFALVFVNLAGLAILVLGTLNTIHFGTSARFTGFVLAVFSGILFSVGMLLLEVMKAEGVGGEQIIFSGSIVGTALLLPLILFLPIEWSVHNLVFALPMGMLATALGGILYFHSFEVLGPAHAPIIAYIEPLVGILLGMIVLLESYPWYMYAGIALILGSGIYERYRSRKAQRKGE